MGWFDKAFVRGAATGIATGLGAADKYVTERGIEERKQAHEMTLAEFREEQENQRHKEKLALERELDDRRTNIATAKMGLEEAGAIEDRKLKKQYYDMMEKYYASQGGGGGKLTEAQIKRFSVGAARSVINKYGLRDIAGASSKSMDADALLNYLYSFAGGAETPELKSNIEAAIAELEQISESLATNPAMLGPLMFGEEAQDPNDPAGVRALISGGAPPSPRAPASPTSATATRSNFADTPLTPLAPLPQGFDPNDPKWNVPSGGGMQQGLFDAIEVVSGHTGRRRI